MFFNTKKSQIEEINSFIKVELFQNNEELNLYFTYSDWEDEELLDKTATGTPAVLLATAKLLVGWLVIVPKELHRGHDITGSQA